MALTPFYRKRNIDSVMGMIPHTDALQAFTTFGRVLEQIDLNAIEYVFEQYKVQDLIPTLTLAPGFETYTYTLLSRVGTAKWIANGGMDDLPRVDVLGEQVSVSAKKFGAGYGLSVDDIELQSNPNVTINLGTERQVTMREAMLQWIERIGAIGDTNVNIYGLANAANSLTYTLANSQAQSTTSWGGKTGKEILADLNGLVATALSATKGQVMPDTLVLPSRLQLLALQATIGDINNTSALNFFLSTNGYIKAVVTWEQLVGAGSGGTDRIVMFKRDPRYVQLIVGADQNHGPVPDGLLAIKFGLTKRTAGVVSRFPLAVLYADGA